MNPTHELVVVVPCFNEADRLPADEFLDLAQRSGAYLIFVNDGSTDATGAALKALATQLAPRAEVLELDHNKGKGEAVRQGLRRGLELNAEIVGYVDADMATPPREVQRLIDALEDETLAAALGSRLAILGHTIERTALRHYLGRVFATGASLVLDIPIYDTQCGAKFFRVGDAFRDVLKDPFVSRWAFDVELIGRLLQNLEADPAQSAGKVHEIPVREWRNKDGSKLNPISMIYAFAMLPVIRQRLSARQVAGPTTPSHSPTPGTPGAMFTALLWLVVIALTLAPILLAHVPVGADMLNHLARVHVLHNLGTDDNLQGFYQADWGILPNLAMDVAMAPLLHLFGPYLAGKVFICISMLLLFGGVAALRFQLQGKVGLLPLLVALIAYNPVLAIGLANFYFGMGVLLLVFAGCLATADWPALWRWAVLSVAAVGLFFTHAMILACYGLIIGAWRMETFWQSRNVNWRAEWPIFGQFALPAFLWGLVKAPTHGDATVFGTLMTRFEALITPVLYFNDFDVAIAAFLIVVLTWLAASGRLRIVRSMRLAVLVLLIAGLLMPAQLLGVWLTHVRLPVIAALLFLAAVELKIETRNLARVLAAALVLVTLLRLEKAHQSIVACDEKRQAFIAALTEVPKGARLLPVMEPLAETGDCLFSNYWHMPSLAVIEKSAFVLLLFVHMQPLAFNPKLGHAKQVAKRPVLPGGLAAGGEKVARDDWERLMSKRWRKDFDFLIWLHPGTAAKRVPADVVKIATGSFFTIFRIPIGVSQIPAGAVEISGVR